MPRTNYLDVTLGVGDETPIGPEPTTVTTIRIGDLRIAAESPEVLDRLAIVAGVAARRWRELITAPVVVPAAPEQVSA